MTDEQELKTIREAIDTLDGQIQELITRRAELAERVAHIKLAADPEGSFYRPEREVEVLRKVKARNRGPLGGEEMARLFREIMSACLALEQPLNIAFLGPKVPSRRPLPSSTSATRSAPSRRRDSDVFREVEGGTCRYGVVPVENSTEGVVSHTLDMFLTSPLNICGEVTLRINHNLMSTASGLEVVRVVYSHSQSLAQCRGWLDRHLLKAERIPVGSNAEAARLVRDDPTAAAIAGETAAELYGLRILARNIEDEPGNTTRFLVIGKQVVAPSGNDKTSLLLSTRNEAGGLHGC